MENKPTITGLNVIAIPPAGFKLLTHQECEGYEIKYDPEQRERFLNLLDFDEFSLGYYVIKKGKENEFWSELENVQDEIRLQIYQELKNRAHYRL